ncbi:hypothetical protein [Roseobacter sp. HKCCA0434]|uniref:hypothetical protein n=1 Tax=Roseobacter sp. HKCCA0434 TaxID=3079297 RepID=UPI002905EF43|nr:hypothetical protein [Roseobacter sp. HKCCA0434]
MTDLGRRMLAVVAVSGVATFALMAVAGGSPLLEALYGLAALVFVGTGFFGFVTPPFFRWAMRAAGTEDRARHSALLRFMAGLGEYRR